MKKLIFCRKQAVQFSVKVEWYRQKGEMQMVVGEIDFLAKVVWVAGSMEHGACTRGNVDKLLDRDCQ